MARRKRVKVAARPASNPARKPLSERELLQRRLDGARSFLNRLGWYEQAHGHQWVEKMRAHYRKQVRELQKQLGQ